MYKRKTYKIGDKIENLELLENLGYRDFYGKNATYWKCKCLKCGNVIEVPQKYLGKAKKDCGCWRNETRIKIEPGTRFGRLVVVSETDKRNHGATYLCKCDCGKEIVVRSYSLRTGETKSCGCIHDELFDSYKPKAHETCFVNDTSMPSIKNYGKLQSNNTSGVSGVSWHKKMQKWNARIMYQKKMFYLGYYSDIKEAEKIVNEARKAVKKDFSKWYKENFPDKWEKQKQFFTDI